MKIMIAIPCMDFMHTDFVISLTGLQHDGNVGFVYSSSSLIYDSRNSLANIAIREGYDRVLWLDSDMRFSPDLLKRLSEDIDSGKDAVCGLYVTRKKPIRPAVFDDIGYVTHENGKATPKSHPYMDYPKDSVFEVAACGFAGIMTTTELLAAVKEVYGLPFSPILGFGEDISFCIRAKELGRKIYCDSRVKMGHVGLRVFEESDLL